MKGYKKVAIIHYWLVNMRGGEKVVEELCRMFPEADVFTHVYDPKSISETISRHTVITSRINKLPRAKKWYQNYLPLMPNALAELDLRGYDLVISSESGPAKGVVTDPEAFHLCYCHTPMRYIWDMYRDYLASLSPLKRAVFRRIAPYMRRYDLDSALAVDHFAANSSFVAKRIRKTYRRDASVVHPPVDVEAFLDIERKPEDFYFFYGQLVGYKRLDIAIEACRIAGKTLVVIGGGAFPGSVPKHVDYLGYQPAEVVKDHFSRARALLFPGTEDFGIVPIEAAASGCPVIAYKRGGALETVINGKTGLHFAEQTPEALAVAMNELERLGGLQEDREIYRKLAMRFEASEFRKGIESCLGVEK